MTLKWNKIKEAPKIYLNDKPRHFLVGCLIYSIGSSIAIILHVAFGWACMGNLVLFVVWMVFLIVLIGFVAASQIEVAPMIHPRLVVFLNLVLIFILIAHGWVFTAGATASTFVLVAGFYKSLSYKLENGSRKNEK